MDTEDLIAERQQLITRIAEIDAALAAAAPARDEFGIVEVVRGKGDCARTYYRITRNGNEQGADFWNPAIAEEMLAALQRLPQGYHLSYVQGRKGDWLFQASKGSWKTSWGSASAEAEVQAAIRHLAATPEREQRAAERAVQAKRDAAAAAEEARAGAAAPLLATPRQVEFILDLLRHREFSGEGGGFWIGGPTDPKDIKKLTRDDASSYIASLKGDY